VIGLLAATLSVLAISQGRFSPRKGEEPGNKAHYIVFTDHCLPSDPNGDSDSHQYSFAVNSNTKHATWQRE